MPATSFRQSLRMFHREPGFSAGAVLTLALGIAASTAMFSVFDAVLLRPAPYADPRRVVAIDTRFDDTGRIIPRVTGGDWIDLAAAGDLFEQVTHYAGGEIGVQLKDRAEWANTFLVTPNFLQVFGASPQIGRGFAPSDAQRSVVVGWRFAQKAFGAPDRAIGESIRVDQRAYDVIGVMPADFSLPDKADIWLAVPVVPDNPNRSSYNYHAYGRLRTGWGEGAVSARLSALSAQLAAAFPDNRNKTLLAVPVKEDVVRRVRGTVTLLLVAVLLVLLISSANVAHLLLARAASRQRDYAIQAALGAGGGEIVAQILFECLAIGVCGALAGVALAALAVAAIPRLAPADLPRIGEVSLDGAVLAFAAAISLVASLLAGLPPAWQAVRRDVAALLRAASGRAVIGGKSARLRDLLVAGEIALSFALAVGAGLLVRSFVAMHAAPLGFRPESVLVAYAHSPAGTDAQLQASTRFFDQALAELEGLPGVISAGAAMGLPTGRYGSNGKYAVEGVDMSRADLLDRLPDAGFRLASRRYFSTLGVPLLAGRDFRETDQYDAPFVAIVSESLVRRSFPGQNAIGKKLLCGLDSDQWMTIVGVVGDVRSDGPAGAPGPELYMPFEQHPSHANELQLVVRTAGPPEALADSVARKIRSLNPEIAIQTTTLSRMISESVATPRFRTSLITSSAALALALAMAGVYGVMAYTVTRRKREMAMRMALGCAPSGVVGLILRHAAGLAAAGLAVGTLLCAAGTRIVASMLFGVSPTDAAGYLAAIGAIALVTLAAAAIPAWRAARADPALALREE